MFSFLLAAVSVVLTLPFLLVNGNFLYVYFSMSMHKLNDDDDDLETRQLKWTSEKNAS